MKKPGTESTEEDSSYLKINANDVIKELTQNKQLIKMTMGKDDGESSGSDSEPSADNLEESEMAKIVPTAEVVKPPEPKKEEPIPEKKKPSSPK